MILVLFSSSFDAGANVILTDISAQGLRELSEKLSTVDDSRVYAVDGDISTSEGIDSIISECIQFPAPISGAVHCAILFVCFR